MAENTNSGRSIYDYGVFALFLVLTGLTVFYHELWRDELQTYALVRASHSLKELFINKAYEGHPALWYLLLYVLTRFNESPLAMQWLHFVIAGSAAWFCIRYFPARAWMRYAIVFGYFFLYEYAVIARNYAPAVLLGFAFCATLTHRRYIASALLLFLLIQVNVFSFFLGASMFPVLFALQWRGPKIKMVFTAFVLLLACVVFVISTRPPADSGFSPEWVFSWSGLRAAFNSVWNAFVPVPQLKVSWWNTNFVDVLPEETVARLKGVLSAVILGLCVFSLRSSKKALLFFIPAVVLILGFLATRYLGFVRHQGHLYLAYILALWIMQIYPDKTRSPNSFSLPARVVLWPLLVVQIFSGAVACYYDWCYPFSNAQSAAAYITSNYPNAYLTSYPDYTGAAVATCLNRDVYFVNSHSSGQFIIWNFYRPYMEETQVISTVDSIKQSGKEVILISDCGLPETDSLKAHKLQLVKAFAPTIVASEQYFLYR